MKAVKHPKLEPAKRSALNHFFRVDRKLHALAENYLPGINLPAARPAEDRAAVLMKSIIGQQISIKAANSIWQRLQPLLFADGNRPADPKFETLLNNGASAAKAKALLTLSQALNENRLDMSAFDSWSDRQVVDCLIQYPGIGPWTAEMFLISGLGRPDVFSLRDLGLRTALSRLHKLPPEIDRLKPLAETYSPHGTLAALVCWKSLDNGDLYAEV